VVEVTAVRVLPGRGEVLEAAQHHPYARFAAGTSRQLSGIAVEDALLWRCIGPFGPVAHAMGDSSAVGHALAEARDAGLFEGVRRVNLELREGWDYLWLPSPAALALAPGPAVRPVVDIDELDSLLDEAYPDTELRPGDPIVTQWYGLYDGGRLVACAADRTFASPEPDAVPTGVIGAVAVHPDRRGCGLGAAVTAGVASVLLARHDQVGLGVTQGNDVAARLYHRIGFTARHRIGSFRPL
jgi:ribosomal protein S18 acetylase RimI-like enzyme